MAIICLRTYYSEYEEKGLNVRQPQSQSGRLPIRETKLTYTRHFVSLVGSNFNYKHDNQLDKANQYADQDRLTKMELHLRLRCLSCNSWSHCPQGRLALLCLGERRDLSSRSASPLGHLLWTGFHPWCIRFKGGDATTRAEVTPCWTPLKSSHRERGRLRDMTQSHVHHSIAVDETFLRWVRCSRHRGQEPFVDYVLSEEIKWQFTWLVYRQPRAKPRWLQMWISWSL